MGSACSSICHPVDPDAVFALKRSGSPDPVMYDLMRKSIQATTTRVVGGSDQPSTDKTSSTTTRRKQQQQQQLPPAGQHHLLFRHSKLDPGVVILDSTFSKRAPNAVNATTPLSMNARGETWLPEETPIPCPTRLLIRRHSHRVGDEGSGTHIYAIRYPEGTPDNVISEQAVPRRESARQEQYPTKKHSADPVGADLVGVKPGDSSTAPMVQRQKEFLRTTPPIGLDIYSSMGMASKPRQEVMDWVTVSEEHEIYIADVGLTAKQCDYIVNICEQACRGQYAAYTYAKQTLGCREYPLLARTCFHPVHTITRDIIERLGSPNSQEKLQLDDREPHIVKYDVTKKERQKLDMHTDKSEWTFLIALSNGCGVDYEGGGTFFECLDATVHIQRGHALVFPGKLRHCGQKITSGLRFLLVGFLVDKSSPTKVEPTATNASITPVSAVKAMEPSTGASLSVEA